MDRIHFEPCRGIMPKAGEISMEGMGAVVSLMHDGEEWRSPLPPAQGASDALTGS